MSVVGGITPAAGAEGQGAGAGSESACRRLERVVLEGD